MISLAPDGAGFPIPSAREIEAQGQALIQRLQASAAGGRPVVVVQGLGFVGAAVAAVLAHARQGESPRYEVVGVDLPAPGAYWKVARLQTGEFPFPCPDPALPRFTRDAAQAGNLHATCCESVYGLAAVIVVDVPLDVEDRTQADPQAIEVRWRGFEAAIRTVGRHMRPDALVLVETTVPIGTTQHFVQRLLQGERDRRGLTEKLLLAHAYERVMPGPRYADSIRCFWRSFSGIDAASAHRARAFLGSFIDTEHFPLRELADPQASELAKLLENSYRAANIAFIYEWTLLAEQIGVNLWDVVDSIRVRQGTHDNMRYPGFGVGGYCLTKDSLLAQWALKHFYHTPLQLSVTLEALRINYAMPLHSLDLARSMAGPSLAGREVTLCGLSYLPDVPDTRNAPLEVVFDRLRQEQARVRVHDPLVAAWPERPTVKVITDLAEALAGTEIVILAVNHQSYRQQSATTWTRLLPPRATLVDAANAISDEKAAVLHASGHRFMGVGKGHWRQRGYHQYA